MFYLYHRKVLLRQLHVKPATLIGAMDTWMIVEDVANIRMEKVAHIRSISRREIVRKSHT